MQNELKANPKKFWKFVNENRRESGLPTSMRLGEDEADCAEGICELFSMKFASVFSNEPITEEEVLNAVGNLPHREPAMTTIDLDEAAVLAAVTKLKSSASPGPDGIPSSLLKNCSACLMSPLSHLFRLSPESFQIPGSGLLCFQFIKRAIVPT